MLTENVTKFQPPIQQFLSCMKKPPTKIGLTILHGIILEC